MGHPGGSYYFKKIFFTILAIFIVIFLSTPSVLSTIIIKSLLQITSNVWSNTILQGYLPSFLLLICNVFLLRIIDQTAIWESHQRYNKTQRSVFVKALFYLLINNLIVPTIAISTADSLWDLISEHGIKILSVINKLELNAHQSALFFICFVFQKSLVSFNSELLRMRDLSSFRNTQVANKMRELIHQPENAWMRSYYQVFGYGQYNAYNLSVLAIMFVTCSLTPLIIPVTLFYFVLKYFMDSYNHLVVYRQTISSEGKLIQNFIFWHLILLILYNLTFMAFFASRFYSPSVFVLFFNVCVIGFFSYQSRKKKNYFDPLFYRRNKKEKTRIWIDQEHQVYNQNPTSWDDFVKPNFSSTDSNSQIIVEKKINPDAIIQCRKKLIHPLIGVSPDTKWEDVFALIKNRNQVTGASKYFEEFEKEVSFAEIQEDEYSQSVKKRSKVNSSKHSIDHENSERQQLTQSADEIKKDRAQESFSIINENEKIQSSREESKQKEEINAQVTIKKNQKQDKELEAQKQETKIEFQHQNYDVQEIGKNQQKQQEPSPSSNSAAILDQSEVNTQKEFIVERVKLSQRVESEQKVIWERDQNETQNSQLENVEGENPEAQQSMQ